MTTPDVTHLKTLDDYLNLAYPILLVPHPEEHLWYAKIPLLPGCMSDGETPEAALRNVKEAQASWIDAALKCGDEVPEPESPEVYLEIESADAEDT